MKTHRLAFIIWVGCIAMGFAGEKMISTSEAIAIAKRKANGDVIKVIQPKPEYPYYQIQLLHNGRVQMISVNAKGE